MICPECYRDFITTWSDVNGKSCTCQGCGHHWRLSKNKRVEDKDLRAQLARKDAEIKALDDLVDALRAALAAAENVIKEIETSKEYNGWTIQYILDFHKALCATRNKEA